MQLSVTINETFDSIDALEAFAARMKAVFADLHATAAKVVSAVTPTVTPVVVTEAPAATAPPAEAIDPNTYAVPPAARAGRKPRAEKPAEAPAAAPAPVNEAPVEKPAAPAPATPTTEKPVASAPAVAIEPTADNVKKLGLKLIQAKGGDAMKTILQAHGYEKFGDIKPESFSVILADIVALGVTF